MNNFDTETLDAKCEAFVKAQQRLAQPEIYPFGKQLLGLLGLALCFVPAIIHYFFLS